MWIKIEPLDVLLFRESKPFSAGENFRAAGRFPPSPLPLVGALRSRALAHLNVDLQAYGRCARECGPFDAFSRVGTPNSLAPLEAMGPFLVTDNQGVCLPWPKDLLREGEDGRAKSSNVVFLKPKAAGISWPVESFGKDTPLQNLTAAIVAAGMEAPAGGFMKGEHFFMTYLTEGVGDSSPPIEYVSQSDVAVSEARMGITLSNGRTAEEGRIYSVAFTRMQEKASFYLQLRDTQEEGCEKDLLPENGFLSLGGEARAAYFNVLNEDDDENLPEFLRREVMDALKDELIENLAGRRRFKLYLLTPAIFCQGWLPDGVDGSFFTWQAASGVTAKLVASAVGKPDDVGGWDLVNNAPRPLYRAAPAGSVYFFEAEEDFTQESAAALLQQLHFQSIMRPQANSDSFPRFCRDAGFGLAAVGVWDYKKED